MLEGAKTKELTDNLVIGETGMAYIVNPAEECLCECCDKEVDTVLFELIPKEGWICRDCSGLFTRTRLE